MSNLKPASYTGPKILVVGDSYSTFEGCIPDGYENYYTASIQSSTKVLNPSYTWWYKVVKGLDGYLIQNNSYSGTAFAEYSWGCMYGNASTTVAALQFCRRLTSLSTAEEDVPDLILLFGGTNDNWIRRDQRDKSKEPYNFTTYVGANFLDRKARPRANGANMLMLKPGIAETVWVLRNKYPNAKIFFIVNSSDDEGDGNGHAGITKEYVAAIDFMAAGLGCGYVNLAGIAKNGGHPTGTGYADGDGMTAIATQVLQGYRAWVASGYAVSSPTPTIGTEVAGTRSTLADATVVGFTATDYGCQRLFTDAQGRHFLARTYDQPGTTYEVELPANRTVEYLIVGGGGGGGTIYNGRKGGGGAAGAVQEGFRTWSEATTLKVTIGAGAAVGKVGGNTSVTFGEDASVLFASSGGVNGAGWQGSGMDGEGSGSGGGDSSGTTGGLHTGGIGIYGHGGGGCTLQGYPGGGGGAGSAGTTGGLDALQGANVAGKGGAGLVRCLSGQRVEYACGGDGTAAEIPITSRVGTGSGGATPEGGAAGAVVFRYQITDEEFATLSADLTQQVEKPVMLKTKIVWDGIDHNFVAQNAGYTAVLSANEWIAPGNYTASVTLNDGYTWTDGTTDALDFTLAIDRAQNYWTTMPAIDKATWAEGEAAGVISAAAAYGEVEILYDGVTGAMPTLPGAYVATIRVVEGLWTGLEAEIPFEITAGAASRTTVELPVVPPAGVFMRDGVDPRPTVTSTADYTATLTEGTWIEPGIYQLTLSLTNPASTKWSDNSVKDHIYLYTIKLGPTTGEAVVVDGSHVEEEWGEHYQVRDKTTAKCYEVVRFTATGVQVNWTVPADKPIEYLIVGGGGNGGGDNNTSRGGGGGAGGLATDYLPAGAAREVTITVGAARTATQLRDGAAQLTALAGGNGGDSFGDGSSPGVAGGSGGGSGFANKGGEALQPSSETGGFGYPGGDSTLVGTPWTNTSGGGGGGGAGGPGGSTATKGAGGNGGPGLQFAITGSNVWYAAGGGGQSSGKGGSGIGGDAGKPGVDGTGSGGGGGSGKGGSGIAILRYEIDDPAPGVYVGIPDGLASREIPYDGMNHKPVFPADPPYDLDVTEGDWVNVGTYTATCTLKDANKLWADGTSAPKVYRTVILSLATMPVFTQPYDWELDYIESDGSAWFDTGLLLTSDMKVTIDCEFVDVTTDATFALFGARVNADSKQISAARWKKQLTLNFQNANHATYWYQYESTVTGQRYVITLDNDKRSLVKSDGTLIGKNDTDVTGAWTAACTAYIFNINHTQSWSCIPEKMRLYSLVIEQNGEVIRCYQPCVKDDVATLCETVSGTFPEKLGTGSFTEGGTRRASASALAVTPYYRDATVNVRAPVRFGLGASACALKLCLAAADGTVISTNVVGEATSPSDTFQLTLEGLEMDTTYRLRLLADNGLEYGQASYPETGSFEFTTLSASQIAVGEDIVVNGGFENYNGGATTIQNANYGHNDGSEVGTKTDGWTGSYLVPPSNVFATPAGVTGSFAGWLDKADTVSEQILVPASGFYRLSFDYSKRTGDLYESNQSVTVSVGGKEIAAFSVTADDQGVKRTFCEPVFLESSDGYRQTLAFTGALPNDGDTGITLDEVKLVFCYACDSAEDYPSILPGDEIDINGGFEQNTAVTAADTIMDADTALTEGWRGYQQIESGLARIEGRDAYLSKTASSTFGDPKLADEGSYFVAMNRQSAIERTVTVPASGTYTITYQYKRRCNNKNASEHLLQVYLDGILVGEVSAATDTDEHLATIADIPLSAGEHQLRLATCEPMTSAGAVVDDATFIDNVRLVKGSEFWKVSPRVVPCVRRNRETASVEVASSRTNEIWGTHYLVTRGNVDYQVVCFTNAAEAVNWTVPRGAVVEMLVVGGGGAGGAGANNRGGGGGAGAVVWTNFVFGESATLSLSVGAGGYGPTAARRNGRPSVVRAQSKLLACAPGGGAGGVSEDIMAASGGSGGGGTTNGSGANVPGSATAALWGGLGYDGGSCGNNSGTGAMAGGGGGAGSAGLTAVAMTAPYGQGGAAVSYWITGEKKWYAAGGGGGASGAGGQEMGTGADGYSDYLGGSGYGGRYANSPATSGAPNTGSGGGAALSNPGSGADGIIVLRYKAKLRLPTVLYLK